MTPGLLAGPDASLARRWGRSYVLMARYEVLGLRLEWTLILIIQLLMGAGMAIMYGFFFEDLGPTQVAYLVSGAPALALIPVGFVILPAAIADQRALGTYDFTWSLPVPRSAAALASITVATAAALPAVAATILVATWRYDVALRPTWAFAGAVVLTALMTSSVGYGLGHAIKNPLLINLIGNLTIFFVLLFSPIVYPPEQLPGWLQAIHQVLPFQHMAATLRAGLTDGMITDVTGSYAVLVAWTVGAWALAAAIVGRRT
jgi:ABC-2 type transport system permease protein